MGPLIKEETITEFKRNTKEKKIQQDFLLPWDPQQHVKYHDPKTEPNWTKLKTINSKNCIIDNTARKKTNTTHKETILGESNTHGNTGKPLGESDSSRKKV